MSYLNDEEHSGGGVKGTVVDGDDGGTMGGEEVADLHQKQTDNDGSVQSCTVVRCRYAAGRLTKASVPSALKNSVCVDV